MRIPAADFQVLIDCGMFQGPKEWRERNWQDPPVPARQINAVVLTHAHLDHCGWIPRLVKAGFRGPIYATPPTIDLCGILLPDSGHLQEEDAAFYNKHKKSKHDPALPLYTLEEAQESLAVFSPLCSLQKPTALPGDFVSLCAGGTHSGIVDGGGHAADAMADSPFAVHRGHRPGAQISNVAPGKVVRSGPTEGETADILVMESTYGNRQHPTADPRPELASLIRADRCTRRKHRSCRHLPSSARRNFSSC